MNAPQQPYDPLEDQATIQRIDNAQVSAVLAEHRSRSGRLGRALRRLREHHLEWLVGVPLGVIGALILTLLLYALLLE